jgi:hypothetical protein
MIPWFWKKERILREIRSELLDSTSLKSLRHKIVMVILADLAQNKWDLLTSIFKNVTFNPLRTETMIIEILNNYHILNNFPEHKKIFKKICSEIY